MASEAGPYTVTRVETPEGARWRLDGPGLSETREYPWEEFGEKLAELAAVMNFAWHRRGLEEQWRQRVAASARSRPADPLADEPPPAPLRQRQHGSGAR